MEGPTLISQEQRGSPTGPARIQENCGRPLIAWTLHGTRQVLRFNSETSLSTVLVLKQGLPPFGPEGEAQNLAKLRPQTGAMSECKGHRLLEQVDERRLPSIGLPVGAICLTEFSACLAGESLELTYADEFSLMCLQWMPWALTAQPQSRVNPSAPFKHPWCIFTYMYIYLSIHTYMHFLCVYVYLDMYMHMFTGMYAHYTNSGAHTSEALPLTRLAAALPALAQSGLKFLGGRAVS